MYKKKGLLITFEGIEGSGKTYHCKKLFGKIKKLKHSTILLREPGGSYEAERIRQLILLGHEKKFDKLTDTLLYLSARNENFKKNIFPSLQKKKIILCDRFLHSTIAYQHYGLGVDIKIINDIHKKILGKRLPDLTFLFTLNIKKALNRVKIRNKSNRYDKFPSSFYNKVQKGFKSLASLNKKKFVIVNTDQKISKVENIVYDNFLKFYYKNK